MRQDFRISFSFVVVYAMGDPLPSGNRMWIFFLLETKVCKARRPAVVISTQFVWVVLVLSPHFPCSACLVRCSPTRFWSISCQYYVQTELGNWTTVGSTPAREDASCQQNYVIVILLWSLLSSCLHSFIMHLTSGINVAKCSKNPRKLSVCTMWSSLKKTNVCNSLAIVCMWHQYPLICAMTKVFPSWQW